MVSDSIVTHHEVTEMNDDPEISENPGALEGTWRLHMDLQHAQKHPQTLET